MEYYKYFIIPNPAQTNPSQQPTGPLIVRVPQLFPNIIEGNGPYSSLDELKHNSKLFKDYGRVNQGAEKIVQERFIKTMADIMYVPGGASYQLDYIKLFEHIGGKIKKKEVSGIHFYDPKRVKVIRINKVDFYTGVWEAVTELLNRETGEWIRKRKPSNFFPLGWSRERTFFECNYAFENKIKNPSSNSIFDAVTKSGVPVKIIILERKVKTLYPVLKYI